MCMVLRHRHVHGSTTQTLAWFYDTDTCMILRHSFYFGYLNNSWIVNIIFSDHNFEKDTLVKGYEGPGEYEGKLVYRDPFDKEITIMQLRNLVDVSDHCRQHIMWNCSSTAFNPPEKGRSYRLTYWSNRDNVEMTYW